MKGSFGYSFQEGCIIYLKYDTWHSNRFAEDQRQANFVVQLSPTLG